MYEYYDELIRMIQDYYERKKQHKRNLNKYIIRKYLQEQVTDNTETTESISDFEYCLLEHAYVDTAVKDEDMLRIMIDVSLMTKNEALFMRLTEELNRMGRVRN